MGFLMAWIHAMLLAPAIVFCWRVNHLLSNPPKDPPPRKKTQQLNAKSTIHVLFRVEVLKLKI